MMMRIDYRQLGFITRGQKVTASLNQIESTTFMHCANLGVDETYPGKPILTHGSGPSIAEKTSERNDCCIFELLDILILWSNQLRHVSFRRDPAVAQPLAHAPGGVDAGH
jgi:hypothetical protein